MPEIEVTKLVHSFISGVMCPVDYACSQAERGDYAGRGSWEAAVEDVGTMFEEIPDYAIREHFAGYGAWSDRELDAMSKQQLDAMLLQEIASEWRQYAEHGERDGRLVSSDENEEFDRSAASWYFWLGD